MQWGKRIGGSLQQVEEDLASRGKLRRELPRLDWNSDAPSRSRLPEYFAALAETVDTFLAIHREEVPATRMCKLLGQAGQKEYTEQQNLLANQEFRRLNVRVAATLDQPVQEQRKNPKKNENDEEQLEAQHAADRDKYKNDAINRIAERESPRRGDRDQDRRERDNAREQGDVS